MGKNLLRVTDLRTEISTGRGTVYPISGVSITIGAGETLGLVGESGSGKTMTGMSIMRLLPPGASIVGGSIEFCSRELTALSEKEMRKVRGREIAMIFQEPMTALNPTMKIGRQIGEVVELHDGLSKKGGRARAREMLELVGIPHPSERLEAFPHELSGGMRQRAMIAMALVCRPSLLIADEPTTALDVSIQAQILELLDDLRGRLDMSMLLVTHDVGVLVGHADRLAVMYAGRVVEEGPTAALVDSPAHPYTEGLLASVPSLEHISGEPLPTIAGAPPDLREQAVGCPFAPRCRYATERCRREMPALRQMDELGRTCACFHPRSASAGAASGDATRAASSVTIEVVREQECRPADPTILKAETGLAVGAEAAGADSASTRAALLQLDDVRKSFAVRGGSMIGRAPRLKAVAGVSFSVAVGETLGLVGESGCGKTTLGRMIVGLDRPDSGAVRFDGHDLARMSRTALREHRRDLQFVFQDPHTSLDPRMRVGVSLAEPLVIQGIGNRHDRETRVRELLSQVGLSARDMTRYPHEFSGGQRQRIGIARALAVSPRLIVADEPVSALDVSIQAQILNLMNQLQDEFGLTYIVISHDLAVVRYLADRVGVMYLGKLVELGRAGDVYDSPAHPYTAGLLEAIPVLEHGRRRRRTRWTIGGELPSAVNPPSGCVFRTRCPIAQTICAEEAPQPTMFHRGHSAACHFPLQDALPSDEIERGLQ